ncbi:DedA family inner membrane protein YohD [Raoultella terrigena]|uniref:DedA family inner membrane protein YohD n=1 Tax=Raoultella terrigena TaxID=577 RepID=A0A7Z9CQP5_RAOTE|nr:DedA family inner membrane protein YohD [Raoultella terrigena]
MDINNLISHYGYAALVIGSIAEGETITLLGGVAAHQGLLKFPLVVISVALGGMIGDQLLYLLGRRFGGRLLRRFSRQQARIRKAQRMIQRRPYLFVIGTRFMYGFRIIGPLLIGASRLPRRSLCRSISSGRSSGRCCSPPSATWGEKPLARGCIILMVISSTQSG